MLLSDKTIRSLLESGDLLVVPEPKEVQLQPVSIDLRLGTSVTRLTPVGPRKTHTARLVLRPGEFLLAATLEHVRLPDYVTGFVSGKSTWARRGLVVESAGLVDPGFKGTITLELKNLSDLTLPIPAGEAICQMHFMATDCAVLRPYGSVGLNSHYQGQTEAEPARD